MNFDVPFAIRVDDNMASPLRYSILECVHDIHIVVLVKWYLRQPWKRRTDKSLLSRKYIFAINEFVTRA